MNKKIVFASTLADPRKLIYRNKWLVPETVSAEELIKVIDELMVKDS